MPPHALSVAGVDPSGDAGILADLHALRSLGIEAAGAVTLLTVQDADGVHRLEPVDPGLVAEEIRCLDRSRLAAVKTGALSTPGNVEVVRDLVEGTDLDLVVDPVLVAASGGKLGVEGMEKAFRELLPHATVTTPNVPEAKALTGEDADHPRDLAEAVLDLGPGHALVTGGHADATDVLAGPEGLVEIPGPRVEGSEHGTGCVHSALVAGLLARGASVEEAARLARIRVARRIADGAPPPRPGPVVADEPAGLRRACFDAERIQEALVDLPPSWFPEVGTNVAVHRDGHVASLAARIRAGRARAGAGPSGDGHVARLLHGARDHDPTIGAAVNLRPAEELREALAGRGADVVHVDRRDEPDAGPSMSWVVDQAVDRHRGVPDAVWDDGKQGKEAMLRLFGTDADALVRTVRDLASG